MQPLFYYFAIGIPCAIGSAALIYLALRARRKKRPLSEPAPAPPPEAALAEFATNAQSFIGLFEALRMIREGQLTAMQGDVFEDFSVRLHFLEGAPALIEWWDENFADIGQWDAARFAEKAGQLLAALQAADLERGAETELTVERSVFRYYNAKGRVPIPTGTVAIVEHPYWRIGETVLEKGIISKREEEPA